MSCNIADLETGDILLFEPDQKVDKGFMKIFDWVIQTATHSTYTHVAFVLKDPTFIHPTLKGLYMWESGYEGKPDPQDGLIKLGVQITPIHECFRSFKGKVYVRKMSEGRDRITNTILEQIHDVVYNKPYDTFPKDWIEALFRKDTDPQKTDRFWCSALVSYILVKLDFLDADLDWSMIRPSDLSSASNYLMFKNGCCYGEDICIDKDDTY